MTLTEAATWETPSFRLTEYSGVELPRENWKLSCWRFDTGLATAMILQTAQDHNNGAIADGL